MDSLSSACSRKYYLVSFSIVTDQNIEIRVPAANFISRKNTVAFAIDYSVELNFSSLPKQLFIAKCTATLIDDDAGLEAAVLADASDTCAILVRAAVP